MNAQLEEKNYLIPDGVGECDHVQGLVPILLQSFESIRGVSAVAGVRKLEVMRQWTGR